MLLKKKNTLVGIINLILGILGCLCWFICESSMKKINSSYLYASDLQDTLAIIFAAILLVPLILTLIINLIYIFKNWHNKKSMFMNILTIVAIITSISLLFALETSNFIYIISVVALSGILLLIFNKSEEDTKKHKVIFSIMIINIVIMFISCIGFLYLKSNFQVTYANNEKNMLKTIMQSSTNTNSIPIKAKKSGKYGYIDSNGNTIIDFIYDDCSDFIEIQNLKTNEKYYVAEVSIENELRFITNNNKMICSHKNTKSNRKLSVSYFSSQFISDLKKNAAELKTQLNIPSYQQKNSYDYNEYYNYNIAYAEYEANNIYSFKIINNKGNTIELLYNPLTKNVIYNNKSVTIKGKLPLANDASSYIYYYKNGYIPIYNFEKNIFGWIDLNGKVHYINGKKQILDFSNKYIAVKDYSITSNKKAYLIDYNGNRISDFFNEIRILDKGYLVKKENGKNVYLDNNLKQITQEYDIIDCSRIKDDILIVSNYTQNQYNQKSYFNLINLKNGQIIGENYEYIGGMDNYKSTTSTSSYFNDYAKNFDSINYENINTKLYEMFYN
ncbi:MAG: WG repeat-containing protein [Clostridia bacterium]|nr:WG repeat-containing protein [Clostridia bacterium]